MGFYLKRHFFSFSFIFKVFKMFESIKLFSEFKTPLVNSPAAEAKSSKFVHADAGQKTAAVKVPKAGRGGAAGYYPGVTWVTETKEEFAREWPELYKRQQHTLKQIRDLHKPVHLHGKNDATNLAMLATVCVGGVFYSIYRMTRYVMPE